LGAGLNPEAPRALKKYELLRLLGRGGMAEVYLARTRGLAGFEKLAVVKRLLPRLARHPRFVGMFLDEARLAARLHHANINQVYEIDEVDGEVFLAMEFVPGKDARALTRSLAAEKRTMPIEHAIAIAIGIAAGLHHAHNLAGADGQPLGIVHRDVTPHNVIIGFDGSVKLIDFGIAKAKDRSVTTVAGGLKGKFGYMSPEQCLSQPLDRRSDIFSLAVLLRELTTGRRLFQSGISEYEILRTIIEEDLPPPSSLVEGYPSELEAIVMKGLRRDRVERFQTAGEMQAALERFAHKEGLATSASALADFMRALFPSQFEGWQRAEAEPGTLVDSASRSSEPDLEPDDEEAPIFDTIDERGADELVRALQSSVSPSADDPPSTLRSATDKVTRTLGAPPASGAAPRRARHPRSWLGLAALGAGIAIAAGYYASAAGERTTAAPAEPIASPVEAASTPARDAPAALIAPAKTSSVEKSTQPPPRASRRLRASRSGGPSRKRSNAPAVAKPDPDAPLPR
jgi:serine/threonine protein kinase